MIVVDTSVLVPAMLDDGPDGARARDRLRAEGLIAPELVDLEFVSVLRGLVRGSKVSGRRADVALQDLVELPMRRVAHRPLSSRCWELRDNLTPYDAAYVALAEALDVPLVTADRRPPARPGRGPTLLRDSAPLRASARRRRTRDVAESCLIWPT